MAKGGAFNVSQLIRELGLQSISGEDMRVLETIQPTLNIGDISGTTPPHIGPSAMFGGTAIGIAGQRAQLELRCLAPGGGFIEWILYNAAFTSGLFRVSVTSSGAATPLASAGQLSRDAVVSPAFTGSAVSSGLPGITISPGIDQFIFGSKPLFVPRGAFFQIEASSDALLMIFGFGWREVPASEHVPA